MSNNIEQQDKSSDQKYDAASIKVLEGLEAVRKRPSMYIGDTAAAGLHHLVNEVVDNAIDEAMAGYCTRISVRINADGSCTVSDDGRGFPVGPMEHENPRINGKSAVEVCMTILHAGGKFDHGSYKVSGGLHGVGVSVVNALSEWLEVRVSQDGKLYLMRFERGKAVSELEIIGTTSKTGTRIVFKPDKEIFSDCRFRFETLASRLRELAYLIAGVRIKIADEQSGKEEEFQFDEGLKAFVEYLNEGKAPLHRVISFSREDAELRLVCDLGMQYTDSFSENILAFANNIHNIDGGTHLSGFRSALTRTLNQYARKGGLLKGSVTPSGDDLREGLVAVISVKVAEPQFEAQTKVRLMNPEVGTFVEQTVNELLTHWLEEHPAEAKRVVTKGLQAAQAREAARKARDLSRKSVLDSGSLPGKLWDCSSRDRDTTELFLVEGNSAGGNAKQGRDSRTQAILPLRGKILNVEKARIDKMLSHEEIRTIISALGTGIGAEDFDLEKRRYGKMVIMTDADVDGSHIRTLLLTFLFRHMRPLIEHGHVYVAQPPLFQLTRRGKTEYALTDRELNAKLTERGIEGTALEIRQEPGKSDGQVQRFEGQQLKELVGLLDTLEVQTRILSRRGIDFQEFVTKHFDPQEGLPKMRAILDDQEHFFYDDKQFNKFLKDVQEHLGQVELEYSGETNGGNGGPKPQHVLAKVELSESAVIEDLIRRMEKIGLGIEDYFLTRQEDITGRAMPCKFALCGGDNEVIEIANIAQINKAVRDYGARGIDIKRFKGLGEMNADELWSTTMDPTKRSLMRVSISEEPDDPEQYQLDLREADRIFSILMGESVEPRRAFIETHAAEVKNLDI